MFSQLRICAETKLYAGTILPSKQHGCPQRRCGKHLPLNWSSWRTIVWHKPQWCRCAVPLCFCGDYWNAHRLPGCPHRDTQRLDFICSIVVHQTHNYVFPLNERHKHCVFMLKIFPSMKAFWILIFIIMSYEQFWILCKMSLKHLIVYDVCFDSFSFDFFTEKNCLNPVWKNQEFTFPISCPDLAFIRFEVRSDENENFLIGQETVRLKCVRSGKSWNFWKRGQRRPWYWKWLQLQCYYFLYL